MYLLQSLNQGFWASTLLTFGVRSFSVGGCCAVHWGMSSSVSGLRPPDTRNPSTVMTISNVSRQHQGRNHAQWRITDGLWNTRFQKQNKTKQKYWFSNLTVQETSGDIVKNVSPWACDSKGIWSIGLRRSLESAYYPGAEGSDSLQKNTVPVPALGIPWAPGHRKLPRVAASKYHQSEVPRHIYLSPSTEASHDCICLLLSLPPRKIWVGISSHRLCALSKFHPSFLSFGPFLLHPTRSECQHYFVASPIVPKQSNPFSSLCSL